MEVTEHTGDERLPKRTNAITVCQFGWPRECPFGPQGTKRKLYTLSMCEGCPVDCGYCWAKAQFEQKLSGKLDGRPWREPTIRTGLYEVFLKQVRSQDWGGKWVLLCNRNDPFAVPFIRGLFPDILLELLNAGARPVILSKGVLTLEPGRYLDAHQGLKEAIQGSEHGVWWGCTLTTLDEGISREIEPGAPLPQVRVEALRRLRAWSSVHAPGKVHPWVSIGGWHRRSHPVRIMEEVRGLAEIVIIELMHRKKTDFPWERYVLPRHDWVPGVKELVFWASYHKIPLVLKDELRELAQEDVELRSAYESMWGEDVFSDALPPGQTTLQF